MDKILSPFLTDPTGFENPNDEKWLKWIILIGRGSNSNLDLMGLDNKRQNIEPLESILM